MNSAKPRLLDLFCGAGGAGTGYHRAGFEVVGVDFKPQKHYPFEFHESDALEYVAKHGHEFDAIHASPPCQVHSQLGRIHKGSDYFTKHLDLIPATREALRLLNLPYVIENVKGAPMDNPLMLCGAAFNLKVYRHRLFESNVYLMGINHQPHNDTTPSSGHGISPKGFISLTGNGGAKGLPDGVSYVEYARIAMGIDWMTRKELSQAIPPAYTEFIGCQLMRFINYERHR